jgi:hypothetical protein
MPSLMHYVSIKRKKWAAYHKEKLTAEPHTRLKGQETLDEHLLKEPVRTRIHNVISANSAVIHLDICVVSPIVSIM